jgi:hypothetical protein
MGRPTLSDIVIWALFTAFIMLFFYIGCALVWLVA